MSVMGFQKSLDELYDPLSIFLGKLFNFAKHLKEMPISWPVLYLSYL